MNHVLSYVKPAVHDATLLVSSHRTLNGSNKLWLGHKSTVWSQTTVCLEGKTDSHVIGIFYKNPATPESIIYTTCTSNNDYNYKNISGLLHMKRAKAGAHSEQITSLYFSHLYAFNKLWEKKTTSMNEINIAVPAFWTTIDKWLLIC